MYTCPCSSLVTGFHDRTNLTGFRWRKGLCRGGVRTCQHQAQVQTILYEYVNKNSLCTFYNSLFSDCCLVLVRGFKYVHCTTFCIVEKTLNLVYLSQWYTWVLGHSRAGDKFKSHPVFINFWPLGSQAWDCYEVYDFELNLYCSWEMIRPYFR